jgi:uncharacterized protein YndB with AHSA1/START domain
MSIDPTGSVRTTTGGRLLVLERTFRAPIGDVWASVTEPDRLGRWIGTWSGESGPGRTVAFTMTSEDEPVTDDAHIIECEPPTRLLVDLEANGEVWRVGLTLDERDGLTTLTFTQELGEDTDVGSIGPGWEFYLDRLVHDRAGEPFADFDEYYPAQQAYYQAQ